VILTYRAAASIKKAVDAVNGGGKVEVQHLDLASLKWVALSCLTSSTSTTRPLSSFVLSRFHEAERSFTVAARWTLAQWPMP
jgi:hypothetical protein